jgi:hypothetical protein
MIHFLIDDYPEFQVICFYLIILYFQVNFYRFRLLISFSKIQMHYFVKLIKIEAFFKFVTLLITEKFIYIFKFL